MSMEPMPETFESAPTLFTRSVFVGVAAQLLGVSVRTVYNRIHQGRLRTIRTRCGSQRVLLESVEELLREELRKRSRRTAER